MNTKEGTNSTISVIVKFVSLKVADGGVLATPQASRHVTMGSFRGCLEMLSECASLQKSVGISWDS